MVGNVRPVEAVVWRSAIQVEVNVDLSHYLFVYPTSSSAFVFRLLSCL